jgi:hypothetical protein
MAVFWIVAPCYIVEVYRHFRGACCLITRTASLMMEAAGTFQNVGKFLHGATIQKTAIIDEDIIVAVL